MLVGLERNAQINQTAPLPDGEALTREFVVPQVSGVHKLVPSHGEDGSPIPVSEVQVQQEDAVNHLKVNKAVAINFDCGCAMTGNNDSVASCDDLSVAPIEKKFVLA